MYLNQHYCTNVLKMNGTKYNHTLNFKYTVRNHIKTELFFISFIKGQEILFECMLSLKRIKGVKQNSKSISGRVHSKLPQKFSDHYFVIF